MAVISLTKDVVQNRIAIQKERLEKRDEDLQEMLDFRSHVFILPINVDDYGGNKLYRWTVLITRQNNNKMFLLKKNRMSRTDAGFYAHFMRDGVCRVLSLDDLEVKVVDRYKQNGKIEEYGINRGNVFQLYKDDTRGYFHLGNGTYLLSNYGLTCIKFKGFQYRNFLEDLRAIKMTLVWALDGQQKDLRWKRFFEIKDLEREVMKLNGVELKSEMLRGFSANKKIANTMYVFQTWKKIWEDTTTKKV